MHYALNRKSIYAQLQTFPIIISDPEQDPLKRIAFNRTVCQSHTKELQKNLTYYLVKQERPLSDFPNLLKLQEKKLYSRYKRML